MESAFPQWMRCGEILWLWNRTEETRLTWGSVWARGCRIPQRTHRGGSLCVYKNLIEVMVSDIKRFIFIQMQTQANMWGQLSDDILEAKATSRCQVLWKGALCLLLNKDFKDNKQPDVARRASAESRGCGNDWCSWLTRNHCLRFICHVENFLFKQLEGCIFSFKKLCDPN